MQALVPDVGSCGHVFVAGVDSKRETLQWFGGSRPRVLRTKVLRTTRTTLREMPVRIVFAMLLSTRIVREVEDDMH